MTSNMMVGPFEMGGNLVQMDLSGVKFRVQNGQGKIKKLSADEFERQVEQNAEKIQNGEDFEFKKDNKKTLKIAAAAVGTAAVVAGVIYRKEIGKFFTKMWDKLTGKHKHVRTVYDRETANVPLTFDKDIEHTKRTLQYKREAEVARVNKQVEEFENSLRATKDIRHNNKQKMYENLFPPKK